MKIYAAKIYEIQPAEAHELYEMLDRDRRIKVSALKDKKEKTRNIFAGLLLRYSFLQSGYSTDAWKQIAIEKGPYGKPQIKGYSDFHYSLSHSGEWIICAVDSMPVGADVQEMKPWKLQMAKRFYHNEEYNRLLALQKTHADRQAKEFYFMWTAKESAVKRSGRGIGAGISSYVTAVDYQGIYDINRKETLAIKLYDELTGYIVCVCSKTGNFPERLEVTELMNQ